MQESMPQCLHCLRAKWVGSGTIHSFRHTLGVFERTAMGREGGHYFVYKHRHPSSSIMECHSWKEAVGAQTAVEIPEPLRGGDAPKIELQSQCSKYGQR